MPSGDTPLHLAIRLKMTEVARIIIPLVTELEKSRTKSKGYNPLHEASSIGSSQIIESLLKTGRIKVDSKTDAGNTALHIAAELDFVDILKKLI